MAKDEFYRVPLGRGSRLRITLFKKRTYGGLFFEGPREDNSLWPGLLPIDEFIPQSKMNPSEGGGPTETSDPPILTFNHQERNSEGDGVQIGGFGPGQIASYSTNARAYYDIVKGAGNVNRHIQTSINTTFTPADIVDDYTQNEPFFADTIIVPAYRPWMSHTGWFRVREKAADKDWSVWVVVSHAFPATAFRIFVGDLDAYTFTDSQIINGEPIP